tara:strand:- start:792 stop:971 length:180 start_codon:yes stop_codon:yes gene_type:complete
MKKIIIPIIFAFTSCVSHFESPLTHIEYKGEISEKGVGVLAKPPGWDAVVYLWEYITQD